MYSIIILPHTNTLYTLGTVVPMPKLATISEIAEIAEAIAKACDRVQIVRYDEDGTLLVVVEWDDGIRK